MTAETDLLPLTLQGGSKFTFTRQEVRAIARDYARANVAHAIAAKDAEIDALRTRLEDTVRESTNKIEALQAEVERAQYAAGRWENVAKSQASWELLWSEEKARAEQLAEALQRLVNSFPEEGVLLDAGWDGCEVDEACEAYDAARALLHKQEEGHE